VRVLCAALVLWAASACADEDEARTIYHEGETAYQLGRFADAAAKFERAYELSQRASVLFDAAQSYRLWWSESHEVARLRKAVILYRAFLRSGEGDWERRTAEKLLGELQPELDRADNKSESRRGAWHTAGIATMAIGGASLIASAVLYAYLRTVVVAGCNTSTAQCPANDLARANADAGPFQNASLATVIAGGALVAAGAVAFVLTRRRAKTASARWPAFLVAPLALDGPGAVVAGRF
jgi:hypothetical protein